MQLLSAIDDADAGQGPARLAEMCLSFYSALAAGLAGRAVQRPGGPAVPAASRDQRYALQATELDSTCGPKVGTPMVIDVA